MGRDHANNFAMKYFKEDEFTMGGKIVFDKMNLAFLMKLDKLRGEVGLPLTISSSYRSKAYNKKIGGAPKSFHLKGRAVDIKCTSSALRAKIVMEALNMDLTVGVHKKFVHVDDRVNDFHRGGQILFLY